MCKSKELSQKDKQLLEFMKMHIPDGTEEYVPEDYNDADVLNVANEHFKKLAMEERKILEEIANIRFRG